MSVIFSPCMECKYLFDIPHKDGIFFCKAFEGGIPKDFLFKVEEKNIECNGGIKFDPVDK